MPLNDQAAWSQLQDDWLCQPSTSINFDWRDRLEHVEDTATLRWYSATWGKESERNGLMQTPHLPPPLACSPALRNLRTISTPPFLDHSEPPIESILVFADYDDLWQDINLWLKERRMHFIPNDQSDEEAALKFDHPLPARQEPEYLPQLCPRKVLLCLGAAGIGALDVHNRLPSSSRVKHSGKSISLRYILVRRTFQGLPTVFCGPTGSWYICCDGVFKLPQRTLLTWMRRSAVAMTAASFWPTATRTTRNLRFAGWLAPSQSFKLRLQHEST